MLRAAIAFCAGAAAVHALPSVAPAAAAAAWAALAALACRRWPAAAAALAGCAAAWLAAASARADAWPCARDRTDAVIEGEIAAPASTRPDRTDFDLVVRRAPLRGLRGRRLRLAWYEPEGLPRAGERWRFGVRLRCPRGFANPGAPERELALLRDGIRATGYVLREPVPVLLAAARNAGFAPHRQRVADAIAGALAPGPSVAVLQGLSVGVRGSIPDRLWEAFAITGVAHLVAISGLHVTGCAIAALALLRLAWRRRLLPTTRLRTAAEGGAVVAVTAAYAWLSGAAVPALRTVAMVGLFQWLRVLRRNVTPGAALAIAAALLVAAQPLAVASAGFWLSFLATAALLAAGDAGAGWRGHARQFARAQLAVTALLAPVLAAAFGRLSLVAPLVNAVAIPAFGVLVLPAVLAGTALALAAPEASAGLWRLLAAALDGTWPALERIAAWPWASVAPASQPAAVLALAGLAALAALLLPLRGLRVAAWVALLALAGGRGERVAPGAFTLTVVDVGQGLAAVVETAGATLVFDTGPRWRGGSVAARVSLLPYLRARGIRRIDRLVLSHDDADHTGGAEALAQSLPIAQGGARGGGRRSAGGSCTAGEAWRWDGIDFRVLHPPVAFEGSDNERSCALHVAGAGGAALLLADPEAAAEALLAREAIAADVVLVPHHGSATSSSPPLVAAVSARLGIVSAGFGNRWDLPREDVVARWRAAGTAVLDTAAAGAVQVRFPPRAGPLAIVSERGDRPRWWRSGRGR